MMKIVNLLLAVGVIVAGYFLFRTIKEPIEFNTAKEARYATVIEKLTYIKDLQLAYNDVHGNFSNSFDSLAIFVEQDSMKITKVVGDPDQLDVYGKPVPVTYEVRVIPAKDSLVNPKFDVRDLASIPNAEGEKFTIAASKIEKGRVNVPVFEVIATNEQILKGLPAKYIDAGVVRKVGSLTEPNYNGNW
jgi:hypothetical protein